MKDAAGMFGGRLAGMRIDRHAADRIADDCLSAAPPSARHVVVGMAMIVMLVRFHGLPRRLRF